eukprot:CAMPEP_0178420800 /NCGR_PEP_ID=MMETSP0689_2-20121128/26317_1 /TAXON_ID=160604 /ORGANISM="Amphidinium massartii, Strain CS-259" /LENGTH=128 /DNA_ID=CAMNT_0020042289 /DNA_START=686 /DNA_END=1072 /DNA_ORIENTATION=-
MGARLARWSGPATVCKVPTAMPINAAAMEDWPLSRSEVLWLSLANTLVTLSNASRPAAMPAACRRPLPATAMERPRPELEENSGTALLKATALFLVLLPSVLWVLPSKPGDALAARATVRLVRLLSDN